MGHHVWKIIRQKSVFTRVTDGRRLLYYSIFIVSGTSSVAALASCVHFFIEDGTTVGDFVLGTRIIAKHKFSAALIFGGTL